MIAHVEAQRLGVTGVLATKLHAILDRGRRRDFFALYVMLHQHRLGIASLLSAIRTVYGTEVDEGLMLRALTYFDDAEREAALPGEGRTDWRTVRDYPRPACLQHHRQSQLALPVQALPPCSTQNASVPSLSVARY
jgi:hypothetical protein